MPNWVTKLRWRLIPSSAIAKACEKADQIHDLAIQCLWDGRTSVCKVSYKGVEVFWYLDEPSGEIAPFTPLRRRVTFVRHNGAWIDELFRSRKYEDYSENFTDLPDGF